MRLVTVKYIAGLKELNELALNSQAWRDKHKQIQTYWDLMEEEDIQEMYQHVCPDYVVLQKRVQREMEKRWKAIEDYNKGIVHPPKAEAIPPHSLPDLVAHSRKYGHLKREEKEAKRNAKIGKPDKQEIED